MTEEGTGTESLLQAAMEMARKAGEAHMRHFRSAGLQTEAKFNESDVVTVADKEAERIIISGKYAAGFRPISSFPRNRARRIQAAESVG